MLVYNYSSTLRPEWRVDEDGFLRITARVLKEGVFAYLESESPEGVLSHDGVVMHYIPVHEIDNAALASLEGKIVIVGEHIHQSADNLKNSVGSIAGKPYVKDNALYADMLITDSVVAKKIMSGELKEVSSSYSAEFEKKSGEWNGRLYDGVQHNFSFNHVLLLPEGRGRCGEDVRIINQKTGGSNMSGNSLKVKYGTLEHTYTFSNEADAVVAGQIKESFEVFNETTKKEHEAALAEVNNSLETMKGKVEELEKALADANKKLEEATKELEVVNSAEGLTKLASQAAGYLKDEELVIANEVPADKREAVSAECGKADSFSSRRKLIVTAVMNAKSVDISTWTADAIDGSFETLVLSAKEKSAHSQRAPMGGAYGNSAPTAQDTLSRILRIKK